MSTVRVGALLLLSICAFAYGSGPEKTTITHPKTPKLSHIDQPFSAFQEIDQELSAVDSEKQKLEAESSRIANIRSGTKRARAMKALQRSGEIHSLLRSSQRLVLITTKGETLYRKRKQHYGALLFRDLRLRSKAMRNPLLREKKQSTLAGFNQQQRLFSERLLSLVTQFQAVSGGYAALTCDPGGWACCQPRRVKEDGKTEIRGCTWRCASAAQKCQGGCLGPQTPQTAVAVRTVKPPTAQPPTRHSIVSDLKVR